MKLLFMTDSVDEMIEHLKVHAVKKFGLIVKSVKSKWLFGELKFPKNIIKKYGRRAVSVFKYGLDYLSKFLLTGFKSLENNLFEFLSCT